MNPVGLLHPSGVVCAWCCGRCGQAYTAQAAAMWPDDVPGYLAWQGQHSEAQADRCCCCHECGTELPADVNSGRCDSCAEKAKAHVAAWVSEAQTQNAQREALLLARALDVDAARRLETVMSDISEDAYCASWLGGLEFILWRFVLSGPVPVSGDEPTGFGFERAVREPECEELRRLSEKAGGWWVWDDAMGGHLFVTLDDWRQRYAAHVAKG